MGDGVMGSICSAPDRSISSLPLQHYIY